MPPIEWRRLGAATKDRPGYDAQSLHRAITAGTDANGKPLSRLMPRYALNVGETRALWTYLADLHALQRQGITPDRLRIGVATIGGGRELSDDYSAAIYKALTERLGGGHVFGREVDLVPIDPLQPEAVPDVLAVVGLPVSATHAFTRMGVPVLAPIGALSGDEDPSILRGLTPTREALFAALAREVAAAGAGPVTILSKSEADRETFALALSLAGGKVQTDTDERLVTDVVVLDGSTIPPTEAARIWVTWQSLGSRPLETTRAQIMVALDTPLFISAAMEARAHPILIHGQQAGIVLAEALKAAGRDVSRARLVQALGETVLTDIGLDYNRYPLTGTEDVAIIPLR